MTVGDFRRRLKPWMLPLAMLCGMFFHEAIDSVQFLAPYLIFTMLLITFCRIKPSEFRVGRLAVAVVGVQVVGSVAAWLLLAPISRDLAGGAMICILCPTATAAPVITAMLGGSILILVAISVLSNLAAAVCVPAFFALIDAGGGAHMTFVDAFLTILSKVGPLILAPMAVALLLQWCLPRAHRAISDHQGLSFYLWAVSLIIVVGRAVSFAMSEPADRIPEMIALALVALVACCLQFVVGRRLGRAYGDRIAGAQGLGQKNTVLAVWMAVTYLNPICSIAPAAYILWQNTINSLQLYMKVRREQKVAQKC